MDGDAFRTRGGIWIMRRRPTTWWASFKYVGRSATWPFAQLRVTNEQLVISSVFDRLTVTPTNVVAIAPFDVIPALGRGLSFEVSDREDLTVFWVYRRLRIVKKLTAHGWSVDEESAYA